MIRLPPKKRPPESAPPEVEADAVENVVDEPLVKGAFTAKTEKVRTIEDIRREWSNIPGPNAKRIACAFCGQVYYVPCEGDEHLGCMNFHAAEKKRAKSKEKTS